MTKPILPVKNQILKLKEIVRRGRFAVAVGLGLAIGWVISPSFGVAVAYAIGGSVTVAMLGGAKCRRRRESQP